MRGPYRDLGLGLKKPKLQTLTRQSTERNRHASAQESEVWRSGQEAVEGKEHGQHTARKVNYLPRSSLEQVQLRQLSCVPRLAHTAAILTADPSGSILPCLALPCPEGLLSSRNHLLPGFLHLSSHLSCVLAPGCKKLQLGGPGPMRSCQKPFLQGLLTTLNSLKHAGSQKNCFLSQTASLFSYIPSA